MYNCNNNCSLLFYFGPNTQFCTVANFLTLNRKVYKNGIQIPLGITFDGNHCLQLILPGHYSHWYDPSPGAYTA